MNRRTALAIAALLAAAACGPPAPVTLEFRGPTMGATYLVKVVARGGAPAGDRAALSAEIRAELDRIDGLMSTWKPESELSRFNRSESLEPQEVAPETFEVFRRSLALAEETGGAFDVTLAPLVEAWGFGPAAATQAPPDEVTLARLREAVGAHLLALDMERRTVAKRRPEVRVDFSAVAPGYAADRVGALVAGRGYTDFLVDIGGELLARGRNDAGAPWQIAIERPQTEGRAVQRLIPLTDAAIATSGDYRNYHEVNGERLTHLLDPRTGRPLRHRLASVSVIADEAARADGLATALLVLGPDEGLALADRLQVAALFLVRREDGTFAERASARWDAALAH